MLGLLLAPNAYAPPARAVVGVRRAPEVSMLTRRELASSAGAALLAMGTFSGEANAALTAEFRKADQSKIGVSSVAIPSVSVTNGEKNIKGPLDTSGWAKCESPLACYSKYPGQNLKDGTCGIGKKCPPAVKTSNPKEAPLSPFGINAGLGESYTAQKREAGGLLPAPAPPAPPPAA